jgi:hypothetical protein
MARVHHLGEEALFDCYLAARHGEPLDPPSAEHLADCAACAARFGDLTGFMDGLGAEARAETDAIFTPERLRAQQLQIAKRLAHVGRAARVISFPARVASGAMAATATRIAPRWLAAAAAAGLFFGAALGASYEWETRAHPAASLRVARGSSPARSHLTPVATRGTTPPVVADDDAFLTDLDAALERPRTRALMPFDALTPHVRDISVPIR